MTSIEPAVYLDHAATTQVRPAAADAYAAALIEVGNPSSLHVAGRNARRLVEEAREEVAQALGAEPAEVVFTSGGTEANNLAVTGMARARADEALLASAIEHPAVLNPATAQGGALVPVTDEGVVDLDHLATRLAAGGVGAVSVMWANNETGVVQPMAEIIRLAHDHGAWVHSDAVQAVGHLPVNFGASGLDAMTITGHKIGAPIGIGALLVRREVELRPTELGGGQERGIRSGTVPVPGIRALAAALSVAMADQAAEARRLAELRDEVIRQVLATIPGSRLTGPPIADQQTQASAADPGESATPTGATLSGATPTGARLPHIAHFTFEGCDADALLFGLDMAGICTSSGSACQAGVQEPSHVLVAMGRDERSARSAVRISMGWTTTQDHIDALLAALPGVVERARAAATTTR